MAHQLVSSRPFRPLARRLLTLTWLVLLIAAPGVAAATAAGKDATFPAWSFHLKLWPFDILYPQTSQAEIVQRLEAAVAADANATIVYVEEEHMYGTFVDEEGFAGVLELLEYLVAEAHARGLRVVVYLNGLEVMTHDAVDPASCAELPGETMARAHPDWLQRDLGGQPIVYTCVDAGWLTPDMEDAWVSPFSPYRELFVERLESLGRAGVDAVYVDATFLPGFQLDPEVPRWGSTDPAAAAAFTDATGLAPPLEPDWDDATWRAWLLWRHEAVADYLGDLADAAWDAGMVPFWESSTNDTPETTLLANATAVTAASPLGFSPEVEPDGDWLAAFRMAWFARDAAPDQPLIYLGWPEDDAAARRAFAIALAVSSTLYPTADAPYPDGAFAFADSIRATVLERRTPHWGHVALVQSVRNLDWTYPESSHFDAYDDAFRDLAVGHIPFRVLVLERLTPAALAGFDTVVLPGLPSISDAEHALLRDLDAILLGEVGTRDELWQPRPAPLQWPSQVVLDLDEIDPGLPFDLEAPATTFVTFYSDRAGGHFLFAVHTVEAGEMVLGGVGPLGARVSRRGHPSEHLTGAELVVPIRGELTVLHLPSPRSPRAPGGRVGP